MSNKNLLLPNYYVQWIKYKITDAIE